MKEFYEPLYSFQKISYLVAWATQTFETYWFFPSPVFVPKKQFVQNFFPEVEPKTTVQSYCCNYQLSIFACFILLNSKQSFWYIRLHSKQLLCIWLLSSFDNSADWQLSLPLRQFLIEDSFSNLNLSFINNVKLLSS